MSPENEVLLRDARALVRESQHVKRAAGWADITGQLAAALEHSEQLREELEDLVATLKTELDFHNIQQTNFSNESPNAS